MSAVRRTLAPPGPSAQRLTRRALIAGLGAMVACERERAAVRGPLALWLGGDVHWGDGALAIEGLDDLLVGAVGIVNLEGPVAAEPSGARDGEVRLHNGPAGLASLKRAGVGVAAIVNNHDRDGGRPEQTAAALRRIGIAPAGGVAGVARILDDRVAVTAHDLSEGVPPGLAADLAAARAEILVATFHVTGPPSLLPRPELRRAVDLAIEAGARVVAAHGTHAVGPLERRGGAVVAWGLGNVAFACDCTDERDGALLRVDLGDGRTGATVVPIDAGLRGAPVRPSRQPGLMFDLFAAIGSSPLTRGPRSASF